jgi:tripartite-type tricarboxylate transporter receptor subunit TctC
MTLRLLAALIAMALAGAAPAPAQDYPAKPVRIVVGFAPGGLADMVARQFADFIARESGQTAVVENRTGAAGTIAADAVAKAAPDGYTLGVVIAGQLVVNPFAQKQMPFDVLKDLVPVAAIVDAPQLIAIHAGLPAKTAKEFIALAKSKPGVMSYGSAGRGSFPHLSAALFLRMAGIDMVHVPYRGNAPAITDLMGGQVQLVSSSIDSLRPGLDAGKIRVIVAATKNRVSYLPDVPTSAEAGVPGYEMSAWLGVIAPAATPAPVVARIHALVGRMMKDEAVAKRLAASFLEPKIMSHAAFADYVKAEYAKWQTITREAGIEPQ